MIKKISATLLALVLCLSVVVIPASAATVELGDAGIAFSLEWDKEYYNAGDTAVLSVYMDAADDLALFTGSFLIGLNSSVISQADNPIADVKANSTTSDLFGSYWKPAETNLSWLATTVASKVTAANTAEEKALYDHYLKFTAAKNTAGSHENALNNKDGFYGSEFDPTEPIMTISFTVAAGVPDGTVINAAIPSGSLTSVPAQTAWKYYSNPGNASTSANLAVARFDVTQTIATSTVGEPAVPATPLTVVKWKDQIKFDTNKDGSYAGTFNYRTLAELNNFYEIFDDVADAVDTADGDGILDAGFVFNKGTALDVEVAKAQVEGTGSAVYTQTKNTYLSTTMKDGSVVMACVVYGIADADVATTLSTLAYVKYMQDGEVKYAYYDVVTGTFEGLYNDYYSQQFGA